MALRPTRHEPREAAEAPAVEDRLIPENVRRHPTSAIVEAGGRG